MSYGKCPQYTFCTFYYFQAFLYQNFYPQGYLYGIHVLCCKNIRFFRKVGIKSYLVRTSAKTYTLLVRALRIKSDVRTQRIL